MNAPRGLVRAVILGAVGAALPGCSSRPEPGDPLDHLPAADRARFEAGLEVFEREFTPETGLGPLFNGTSCVFCHGDPVSGGSSLIDEVHATRVLDNGFCDPLADQGGPVYQQQVTPALHDILGIDREGVPSGADRALRTAPDVLGFGLLDAVDTATLEAMADPDDADGDGISGRTGRFFDGRVGRFGRKALVPTLAEFNEGAFQIEQGVTTPNVPDEGTIAGQPLPDGVDPLGEPEISAEDVADADAFVRFLAPPAPEDFPGSARRGRQLFAGIGCADCHVPSLRTADDASAPLAGREVRAYSDLLLHDMGDDLADICLGGASASEFRTEPLMGIRFLSRFLHDGRAGTIEEAIRLHGGEAAPSRRRFEELSGHDRRALLAFVGAL